jgi:hypothetical protein
MLAPRVWLARALRPVAPVVIAPVVVALLGAALPAVAVAALGGCRDADGRQPVVLRPAPVTPSPDAPRFVDDFGPRPADDRVNPGELAEDRARAAGKGVGKEAGEEWVPKEHASGMSRWKDIGVYVDGTPVGFLTWGELPIACKPSWLRDKVSAEKRYGTDDPGWRWARKRYYKFTDYLKAVGVDLRKVKELHVYGPRPSETLIVSGRELRSATANQFWFTFGSHTSGKPLPHAPDGFGNDKIGDKLNGVMVYIDKTPPTLVANDGLYLDGVPQTGVPYFGEPIRGGIRVYLDDRLAMIIKRQELDPKAASPGADGELAWKLGELLTQHGVDTRKVVEMWTIRGDQRSEKFSAAELGALTFQAGSQSRGGVLVGPSRVLANAIALHTRALTPADMPLQLQPDE